MKLEIRAGLGTFEREIWSGECAHMPRVGEDIVVTESGVDYVAMVQFAVYWPAKDEGKIGVRNSWLDTSFPPE